MKQKMKTLSALLLILIFSLLTQSCKNPPKDAKQNNTLVCNQAYTVGIKTNGYETKGKITINEKHDIYFLHEDPNSVLFGMEEWIDSDTHTVKYKEMQWKTTETQTEITKLQRIISKMLSSSPSSTTKESINGKEAIKNVYQVDGNSIVFWYETKNQSPVKIVAETNETRYEINFSEIKNQTT